MIPTENDNINLINNIIVKQQQNISDFYNVYYSNTAQDISLSLLNSDGTYKTVTIPNKAKNASFIITGEGSPENNIAGNIGSFYLDTLNGNVYFKKYSNSNTGWYIVIYSSEFNKDLIVGSGSPEGIQEGSKGTLFLDKINSIFYVKTGDSDGIGWDLIEAAVNIDTTPTSESTNPITSGGIYAALSTKQNTLIFDSAPTAGSTNPVTSGGIYTALSTKQNTLGYIAENQANKSSSYTLSSTTTYANTKALVDGLNTKQPILTAGTNTLINENIISPINIILSGNIYWGNIVGNISSQADLNTSLLNKQDKLNYDATPTINSTRFVTSGNIYNSINSFSNNLNISNITSGTITNNRIGNTLASCPSVGTESIKVISTGTQFSLKAGAKVYVSFSYINTNTGTIYLNVNNTGAIAVKDESGVLLNASGWNFRNPTNTRIKFIYDGAYWRLINERVDTRKELYNSSYPKYFISCNTYSNGYKSQSGWYTYSDSDPSGDSINFTISYLSPFLSTPTLVYSPGYSDSVFQDYTNAMVVVSNGLTGFTLSSQTYTAGGTKILDFGWHACGY